MTTNSATSSAVTSPRDRLVRNVFSNWFATFVTACLAFFISPFLVHTLGKDQYGIWALALSVVAYTNFFDLGMKQSLARFIPRHYARQDWTGLNEVINSSSLMYSVTGTLVLLAALVIGFLFVGVFDIPPDLVSVATVVFILVGVNQATMFFFMAPAALGPFHRWDLSNILTVSRDILGAAVVVFLLKIGYGLTALAVSTVSLTILRSIIQVVVRNRLIPQVSYSLRFISKERMKEMLSFGWVSFLVVVATLIIFNSDNVIVGIFLSSASVTLYAIAGTLINYLRVFASSICVALTPLISHMDSSSDVSQIQELYSGLVSKLFFLFAALCVSILIMGREFIFLWMGPDFEETVKVLHILIIPASLYLPQTIANSFLLGMGRPKPLFYVTASEAVSKIILSLYLVRIWGLYGVAAGTAIPQFVIYIVVYPLVFHRIIGADLRPFYLKSLSMILLGVIFSLPPALAANTYNPVTGWPGFIMDVVFVGIFILAGFWWRVLDVDSRRRITAKLRFRRGV